MNLHLDFFTLRSIFYLLKPSETYYEHVKDVPDYTNRAFNIFFTFILLEQLILLYKNKKVSFRVNDTVSSLSAGIISFIPNFYFRKIHLLTYIWCYENFNLINLKHDSVFTFIITFLLVDMGYYWFHRAAHEVNFFWAAHQTHHSSEEYNITTALRQSAFQQYTSWIFYLPLSLFIPPSIFLVHTHLNLVYQFWIHTEIIDNLGPFEYVLNTASHHRVHHGRNPYCIDKNYAGVLIIWDRLFGTFEQEKQDEQLAYGLVHPLKTWDPIHAQVFNYKYIWRRLKRSKTWSEIFGVIFKGPGWQVGTPRLGLRESLPEVKFPIKKYDVNIGFLSNLYVGINFVFVLMKFSVLTRIKEDIEPIYISLSIGYILFCLTCFGKMFDKKPNALFYECLRVTLVVLGCTFYGGFVEKMLYGSKILAISFTYFSYFSFLGLIYKSFSITRDLNKKLE